MVSRVFTPFRLVVAMAAAAVMVVAVVTSPAAACRCPPRPSFAEGVAKAVYAVRAKVTKTIFIPTPFHDQNMRAEWAANVVTAYKGCLPRNMTITAFPNPAMCGIRLNVGTEYVFQLLSSDFDGKFFVSSCVVTKKWADLTADDRLVLGRANDQVCPSRRY
ncbi:hypothetical protein MMPV_004335 [Pyropia vietnamensis]